MEEQFDLLEYQARGRFFNGRKYAFLHDRLLSKNRISQEAHNACERWIVDYEKMTVGAMKTAKYDEDHIAGSGDSMPRWMLVAHRGSFVDLVRDKISRDDHRLLELTLIDGLTSTSAMKALRLKSSMVVTRRAIKLYERIGSIGWGR